MNNKNNNKNNDRMTANELVGRGDDKTTDSRAEERAYLAHINAELAGFRSLLK